MAKLQLDMDLECDFELYGIATHVGGHRLAWELNRLFDWELVYDRQLESLCKKTGVLVSTHIVYSYKEVEEDIDIRLVLNRVPDGCLTLGQGPNSLDYLLKVRSGIVDLKSVIQTIRTSKLVTLATLLDPNKSGVLEAMFELE
tara:strand:+ start:474 stop:902 length:429 start_codon:yes stop_codon:yes gene_type:complete